MDCIVYGVTRGRHDCVTFTSMYLSIITLTVNGLNAPGKGHRMAQWIEKQKTSKKKEKRKPQTGKKHQSICYLHDIRNGTKHTQGVKTKRYPKQMEIAILISNKTDFLKHLIYNKRH